MEFINKLISKGFKLWGVVVLVVIAWVLISSAFDSTPTEVKNAKHDMSLKYTAIYQQASCSVKDINKAWFMLCHSKNSASGGLYEVKVDGDTYQLFAVNGKAKQHLGKLGLHILPASNQNIHPADVMAVFKDSI